MPPSDAAVCLDTPVAAPASGRSHVALVLLALAMGGFAIGVTEFAAMSVLPDFAAGLGVDEPTAGHVISAYAAGVVVGAPILAVLGARAPRWLLLVGFMGLFAIGNGLSALAPTYEWMLAFRFLSGIPHGAYFGVAALVAASLVPLRLRTRAVSTILLGLTVATVIGVPVANMVSHAFGWRWTFAIVSVLAILTMALVALFAPRDAAHPDASPWRELGAIKRKQVWFTLGIGAIGFGGMFSVFSYIKPTLIEVAGLPLGGVPFVLALFGLGMVMGNLVGSRLADKSLMRTIGGLLVYAALVLAMFTFAAHNVYTAAFNVFLIGTTVAIGPALQIRLMDVAGDAQTLAAALNHSAFNMANALGAWLGGVAIASGLGWTSTGWVGALLALAGVGIFGWAVMSARASVQPGGARRATSVS